MRRFVVEDMQGNVAICEREGFTGSLPHSIVFYSQTLFDLDSGEWVKHRGLPSLGLNGWLAARNLTLGNLPVAQPIHYERDGWNLLVGFEHSASGFRTGRCTRPLSTWRIPHDQPQG